LRPAGVKTTFIQNKREHRIYITGTPAGFVYISFSNSSVLMPAYFAASETENFPSLTIKH
ncbi:MAG: hypothetical protein IKM72_17175, partial [Oscillospiraceae bacterium]|nr:hypothetical protein [Oscillospiraceae bacterium]